MRQAARFAMLGALASAALFAMVLAPAAQAAGFGIEKEKFEAGTCNGNETEVKSCEYTSAPSAFYTQAAGHPPWGLTGVELAHTGTGSSRVPTGEPLTRLRVDVPPGLAADPQTLETCSRTEFQAKACKSGTEAGFVELEAVVEVPLLGNTLLALKGKVFNLAQESDLPLLFGIEVEGVKPIVENVQLFLEGHVSSAKEPALEARGIPSGDYHEWFEIKKIPTEVEVEALGVPLTKAPLKTLKSKLFFNGHAGKGNFLTLPSVCGAPSLSTSYVEVESKTGEVASTPTVPPVGIEGCGNTVPPFKPSIKVNPQNPQYDQPDGAITEVTVPQHEGASDINTADIAKAQATFPEGLTLNPSAAQGLEACAPAAIHFESTTKAECPAGSNIGKIKIETDLPPGSLAGNLYLGAPKGLPITGPPYTIYAVAESVYGVAVKVEGTVQPDPSTGRLTAYFENTAEHPFNLPQLPFSGVVLELNTGPRAPLANPLGCGEANTESGFLAYSSADVLKQFTPSFPFPTTGCPSSIPFALTQSATPANTTAGAYSPYTFNLTRADGQQYLSQVSTTLPAGLLGAIPSVTLCGEPRAAAGHMHRGEPDRRRLGHSGRGAGTVPALRAGLSHGSLRQRSLRSFDPGLGRGGTVQPRHGHDPRDDQGQPHHRAGDRRHDQPSNNRGRGAGSPEDAAMSQVNRPSFIFNPTNCSALATESTLTSTFNATQGLSSPFQVGNCGALAFKPSFKTATSAKTSKLNGASLQVSLTQPAHEANMKSVFVELPKQLPSKLTTLQKACPEATFAANPVNCRALGSEAGSATVVTPVLPGKLSGSAYLVSHGGEAFPDLDIVLEGDGVKVILTGNTKITKGITSSTFAAIPDVPVTSFVLNLPVGPHSALTAIGGLCLKPLLMPTTITAQSGAQVKQNTRISVSGCGVRILSHRVVGHKLIIKVRTLGAGLITLKGTGLPTVSRRVSKSATVTFKLTLTRGGLKALSRAHRTRRKLKISVRVAFTPKQKGQFGSAAEATVTFKR